MRNYLLRKNDVAGNNRNYTLKHAAQVLDYKQTGNRDYNNKRYSKRINFSDAGYNLLVENRHVKSYDAISNPIARLGVGTDNIINAHEYIFENITKNYGLLNTLYKDNWLVQNIIQLLPQDIVKKWFTITGDFSPDELEKINDYTRKIRLHRQITEGMQWARLYGGAAGILLVKGQTENLNEPLDLDIVMPNTFLGIYIIPCWQFSPNYEIVDNPEDENFGYPEYYDVFDSELNISAKVHCSKLIRFEGRELPPVERANNQYWGISELESVYREIVRRDTTAENIASLIFKANLSVMHIKDLDQIFAINSVQAQERFWNTMQSIATVESSMGIKLVGAEDRAEFLNYGFNGIKDIYEGIMMDLAGATHIPVTKLFGRSPAGMNSTGESDLQNYYDYIDEIRDANFRPIIKRLLPLLCLSVLGKIPNNLNFEFPEMKTLNDSEKAQLLQQYTSPIIEAFNSNLITQDMAQKELKKLSEKLGVFDTITEELIEQSKGKFINDLQQMQDPMAGMAGGMGGADNGNNMDLMTMLGGNANESNNNAGQQNTEPNTNDAIKDEEKPDNIEQALLAIKENIINNKPNIDNYNLDGIDIDTNIIENKDTLLAEYERLEKINKDLQKDYDTATIEMYKYSSGNDIPLNIVNAFNNIKNKFINSNNNLNKLKQKIDGAGYHIDLMKYTGEFDKEMKDIVKQLNEIKERANAITNSPVATPSLMTQPNYMHDSQPADIRLKLIEFIDKLIEINKRVNKYSGEIQMHAEDNIDKKITDINTKIDKLFDF